MPMIIDIENLERAAAEGRLVQGNWGNATGAVCMMSALVPGANGTAACVTAGWPRWLVELNVSLFDSAPDIATGLEYARRMAAACAGDIDFDAARDRFLIALLTEGEHSALASLRRNPVNAAWWQNCEAAVTNVAGLLTRRLAGEDVDAELAAARAEAAAEAAEAAPAWAAARAARAAARAAAAWAAAAWAAAAWAEAEAEAASQREQIIASIASSRRDF